MAGVSIVWWDIQSGFPELSGAQSWQSLCWEEEDRGVCGGHCMKSGSLLRQHQTEQLWAGQLLQLLLGWKISPKCSATGCLVGREIAAGVQSRELPQGQVWSAHPLGHCPWDRLGSVLAGQCPGWAGPSCSPLKCCLAHQALSWCFWRLPEDSSLRRASPSHRWLQKEQQH